MPHTHPEQLTMIGASQVGERFRNLHPVVALISATRLLQFLEREGLLMVEHRRLCADVIRSALPSLEAGPGHDPANLPPLHGVENGELEKMDGSAPSVSAGVSTPATVHDKTQGVVS